MFSACLDIIMITAFQHLVMHAGIMYHSQIRLAVDQGDKLLSVAVNLINSRGKSLDPVALRTQFQIRLSR